VQWGSISEFFAMGGYGLYVWGSYVVTAAVIAIEIAVLVRRARTLQARAGRNVEAGSD
jgi:heme exporter protein D